MPKPRPKQTKKEAYRQEHNDYFNGVPYDRGRRRIRVGDSGGDWDAEETFAGKDAGKPSNKKLPGGWGQTVGSEKMDAYYKEQNDKEKK